MLFLPFFSVITKYDCDKFHVKSIFLSGLPGEWSDKNSPRQIGFINPACCISPLFIVSFDETSVIITFWLGLWKNEQFAFFYIQWKFIRNKEINHWLMFSNCWSTIWNKYLISLCVKHNLVSSASIIRSNAFEAFFKLFTYKRNRRSPKIEPFGTPQLLVSELVLSFSLIWMSCLLFKLIFPWILSFIPLPSVIYTYSGI